MSVVAPLRKPRLRAEHARVLADNHFEAHGTVESALRSDDFDGDRVLYAIVNPEGTDVVYVGDTETGRDLRARLRAHMKDREKAGKVELNSAVWVHFMVTEFKVLSDFEDAIGGLPALNKRKVQK